MQHIIIWIIRFRRIRFVLTCSVFMIFYAIKVTYEDYVEIKPIVIKRNEKNQVKTDEIISCYYTNDTDVFPSAEDPAFSPKKNSIFFIETLCKEKMTMLQACAIESAAMINPDSKVYILLSSSINESLKKGYLGQVLNYPNVYVLRIHINQYAKGMALGSILANDIMKINRRHPIEDVTNMLKIVTLYKWGGIVLDSDMIVLRPFENLPKNWVVRLYNGISSGVLSFANNDLGRNITSEIMKELAKNYVPKSRIYYPLGRIIFRVLKRMCPNFLTAKSGECKGLKVFSEDLFYPIHVPSPNPYVDENEGGENNDDMDMPHTFHIKNMDYSSYPSEEWPSVDLARIFCPKVYEYRLKII